MCVRACACVCVLHVRACVRVRRGVFRHACVVLFVQQPTKEMMFFGLRFSALLPLGFYLATNVFEKYAVIKKPFALLCVLLLLLSFLLTSIGDLTEGGRGVCFLSCFASLLSTFFAVGLHCASKQASSAAEQQLTQTSRPSERAFILLRAVRTPRDKPARSPFVLPSSLSFFRKERAKKKRTDVCLGAYASIGKKVGKVKEKPLRTVEWGLFWTPP